MKNLIYLVLIMSIFILSSCTLLQKNTIENNITVQNPGEVVIDFNNLSIDKGEYYQLLKETMGLSSLIQLIDRDLLESYQDQIDTESVDKIIKQDQDTVSIEVFYENMVLNGVIDSVDDALKEDKIRNYYKQRLLQKTYVKEQGIIQLMESTIQDARDNYQGDLCIILLNFSSLNEATKYTNDLNQTSDKLMFMREAYQDLYHEFTVKTDTKPFYFEPFTCEYELVSADDFRGYPELNAFLYGDNVTIGNYTTNFITDNNRYFLAYIQGKPSYLNDYKNTNAFDQYIINELIESYLSTSYIKNQIVALHQQTDLKIYDTFLSNQYKSTYRSQFKQSELNDETNHIVSYKKEGQTVYITADDLYDEMKTVGLYVLMDKIHYEALNEEGITLSDALEAEISSSIKIAKTNYLGSKQSYSWSDYIAMTYGAFSEEDLIRILGLPRLTEQFILGTDNYTGVYPVIEEEIESAYNNWFKVRASHIYFKYDKNNQEAKELAYSSAKQIIDGCSEDDVLQYTCYIHYDIEQQTPTTPIPFIGLKNVQNNFGTIFSNLAKFYSDDPSAVSNHGDLGSFGPGVMVVEFENAVRDLMDQIATDTIPYTLTPIETVLEIDGQEVYGYHVIYIKDVEEKVSYSELYHTIKTKLEGEHTTVENQKKYLALLCESLEINFNDEMLQKVYENILNMYTED